jgi:hypothetical protein
MNGSTSPVLALRYNILSAFEKANESFQVRLQAAVEQGRISPEIELDERPGIPVTPKISRESLGSPPEIRLQVTYLEILWAFIYAWMILYEEGVQKSLLRGESPAQIDDRTPLLSRARELFEWALGLRASYTPWPAHLPSPENYRSSQERWYGEKANLVFQEATSFMLVHEFIHAEQRHLDIRAANPANEVILELEKDADNGAFEALVNPMLNDAEKLSRGWAILAALLSSYLVKGESTAKQPTTHLPLHHRLEHMLRGLNFEGEAERAYFEYLISLVLRHILHSDLDARSPSVFDTAADALTDKLDRLDGLTPQA